MTKLFIEDIKEIGNPDYTVDLEVEFTQDADAAPIKWEKKVIPIETIEKFYYDEGLQYRMLDSSNPFFEGGHRQQEWTVDFWEEVERGYLEDFLKDYLIKILK